jgi:hypothetical protein
MKQAILKTVFKEYRLLLFFLLFKFIVYLAVIHIV